MEMTVSEKYPPRNDRVLTDRSELPSLLFGFLNRPSLIFSEMPKSCGHDMSHVPGFHCHLSNGFLRSSGTGPAPNAPATITWLYQPWSTSSIFEALSWV